MREDPRPPMGRPPLRRGESTVSLSVRVPASDYDAACQRAATQRLSLAAWTRQTIARRVRTTDDADE